MGQQEFKDTNLKTINLRQSYLTQAASSENMGRAGVRKSDKLCVTANQNMETHQIIWKTDELISFKPTNNIIT